MRPNAPHKGDDERRYLGPRLKVDLHFRFLDAFWTDIYPDSIQTTTRKEIHIVALDVSYGLFCPARTAAHLMTHPPAARYDRLPFLRYTKLVCSRAEDQVN